MGTEICLEFGGCDLACSKNHRGMDHGALFRESDRVAIRRTDIDYDWYAKEGIDPAPSEMAFARRLGDMVPRLELLGFTLANARAAYARQEREWREMSANDDDPEIQARAPLTFDEFARLANSHAVADLDGSFVDLEGGLPTGAAKGRFAADDELFARVPCEADHEYWAFSERSYFCGAVAILHPYLMLRIWAENERNRETDVVWQYGPLVENGWAAADEFMGEARRTETFLVATEGSSDAHILRHAFALLHPAVSDFFRFIDMSERHPFPGTGNLLKFAEGLAKIDVHNQTLFVFDNDAEGADAFRKLSARALPPNMRAMLLPDLDCFRSFPAKGPEGDHLADINGRAAAIECYLDHRVAGYPPARIIWSNYREESGIYQGALQYKESYVKPFLKLTTAALAEGGYDTDKIRAVLDALVANCTSLASDDLARRFQLSSI